MVGSVSLLLGKNGKVNTVLMDLVSCILTSIFLGVLTRGVKCSFFKQWILFMYAVVGSYSVSFIGGTSLAG